MNRLYYGDCLTIMQEWPLECVDLIYLDPPFNSNRNYNAIYKDETGRPLPDQIEAFCDMWELDEERERAIRTMPVLMRENGIDDSTVEFWKLWMRALRDTQPRLLAYLSYMVQRLLIMRRILKPTGSLYLHCDSTASHYIKALLDAIFGHDNFRNEIIWRKYGGFKNTASRKFTTETDTIFFYSKSNAHKFNKVFRPLSQKTIEGEYKHVDSEGRRYAIPRGRMFRRGIVKRVYLDEHPGVAIGSLWAEKELTLQGRDNERMGYATQKPLALLERIIKASSDPDDVVLDPFCGCATTLEAAHKLGRNWVGIDIAIHAVKRVARVRLTERLGLVEGQDFTIEGVPRTLEGAQDLWRRDKYHFQKWAVEQIEGFVTSKRTADGGIDGRVYFAVPDEKDLQSMVVEVKGGAHVSIADLRALKGVLDNDMASMAGLITMRPLLDRQRRNFDKFMAGAGTLEVLGIEYPRMQTLSVEEILEGKSFNTPTVAGRHTLEPRLPGLPAVGV